MSDHAEAKGHARSICARFLTAPEDNLEMTIYRARELYPCYPGIIDVACREIGREYCHPKNPDCESCPMSSCCLTHEAMGLSATPCHSHFFTFKSFEVSGERFAAFATPPKLFLPGFPQRATNGEH